MTHQTAFEIDTPAVETGQTLLVGLASPGMVGLTTATHLVTHAESEEIGHVAPTELPGITPFEDGMPRHHTRVYNLLDSEVTVLVGELFVPTWAARPFVDALLDWCVETDIGEIAFLHPVPYPHGPDDHRVFYVATERYRDRRLPEAIPPMTGGVLDGVAGELVSQSLSEDAPPTGVFITPAHPPGPDIDGALRFLDAIESVYDLAVDREELEELSREIEQYYEALDERMATLTEASDTRDDRDFYADRMYM